VRGHPCLGPLCLAALLAGCGSPLQEGNYALTAQVVGTTQDSCHLLPAGLPTLWQVRFSGSEVMLFHALPGTVELTSVKGRRQTVKDGAPDTFFASGMVQDRPFTLEGKSCSVHLGQLELRASVESATTFTGTYTLFYDLWADQPGCGVLRCDLSVDFHAVRAGP
jgi:hypothetical protein